MVAGTKILDLRRFAVRNDISQAIVEWADIVDAAPGKGKHALQERGRSPAKPQEALQSRLDDQGRVM